MLLPPPHHAEQRDANELEEEEEDSFELDNGAVKWPKKTVLLDTDFFEVEDSWHDTPPEGFNLTVGIICRPGWAWPIHYLPLFFLVRNGV